MASDYYHMPLRNTIPVLAKDGTISSAEERGGGGRGETDGGGGGYGGGERSQASPFRHLRRFSSRVAQSTCHRDLFASIRLSVKRSLSGRASEKRQRA